MKPIFDHYALSVYDDGSTLSFLATDIEPLEASEVHRLSVALSLWLARQPAKSEISS